MRKSRSGAKDSGGGPTRRKVFLLFIAIVAMVLTAFVSTARTFFGTKALTNLPDVVHAHGHAPDPRRVNHSHVPERDPVKLRYLVVSEHGHMATNPYRLLVNHVGVTTTNIGVSCMYTHCFVVENLSSSPIQHLANEVTEFYTGRSLGYPNMRGNFIRRKDREDFFKLFRSKMLDVDVVMCGFPSHLCVLFFPFKVTIWLHLSGKLDHQACTDSARGKLLSMVRHMDKQSDRFVISAAGEFERQYFYHYTGVLPVPWFDYTTLLKPHTYNLTSNIVLIIPRKNLNNIAVETFVSSLQRTARELSSPFQFAMVASVYPHGFSDDDLFQHPAAVVLPYCSYTGTVANFYNGGIPLYYPSLDFFVSFQQETLDALHHRVACNQPFLGESPKWGDGGLAMHPYDPNMQDDKSLQYWLRYWDIYHRQPGSKSFSSYENLVLQLTEAVKDVSVLRQMSDTQQKTARAGNEDLVRSFKNRMSATTIDRLQGSEKSRYHEVMDARFPGLLGVWDEGDDAKPYIAYDYRDFHKKRVPYAHGTVIMQSEANTWRHLRKLSILFPASYESISTPKFTQRGEYFIANHENRPSLFKALSGRRRYVFIRTWTSKDDARTFHTVKNAKEPAWVPINHSAWKLLLY